VSQRVAWSTHPAALEAATAALAEQGSAADALVSGWFALAGATEGGLLAPLAALVVGPGVGARAYDGRAMQPGAGVPRPRGAREDAPLAARAAVPRGYEMMLLLAAEAGRQTPTAHARRGAAAAEAVSAPARVRLLEKLGAQGAPVLRSGAVADALVAAAGFNAGGLLTAEDLDHVPTASATAAALRGEGKDAAALRIHVEPWPSGAAAAGDLGPEIVLAADSNGIVAALAVHVGAARLADRALLVAEHAIALPLVAEPVRRGVPRVTPGTRLAMPRSLAVVDRGAAFRAAIGSVAPEGLDGAALLGALAGAELPWQALAALAGSNALRAASSIDDARSIWSGA